MIDRARFLFANRPAKPIALIDGDKVLCVEYKSPADDDSNFSGFSMGKTGTAMAAGQAIRDGKLKLETKADELIPELNGKAPGKATVRALLRMESGAAEPNPDSWVFEEFNGWHTGEPSMLTLVTQDRVAKADRSFRSE